MQLYVLGEKTTGVALEASIGNSIIYHTKSYPCSTRQYKYNENNVTSSTANVRMKGKMMGLRDVNVKLAM